MQRPYNYVAPYLSLIIDRVPRPSKADALIILLSVSILALGAIFLFNSSLQWIYWKYDDVDHLNIAYNFVHGKGLRSDLIDIEANLPKTNVKALDNYDQIAHPLRAKTPLHLMLLGLWLYFTQANFKNWVFWGNVFNFLLSVLSIIIFYYFTKRHFGFQISCYSTPILALMPSLIWFSVRVRPEILAFLLSILTVHFGSASSRFQNIILAGVFCGLAHFSHPLGMVPGWALLIFYLINKKLKAALIFSLTWMAVIVPWMVRNFLVFGDATQGLGVPIPRTILVYLGLIRPEFGPYSNAAGTSGGLSLSVANVPLYSTLSGMLDEFSRLYGMHFFLIFLSMSIFAFLSLSQIRKALFPGYVKISIFLILIALYGRVVLFAVALNTNKDALPIQGVVLIVIPLVIFLCARLFTKYKTVFMANRNDAAYILALTGILTFVPYLMYAQITGRTVPEVRLLMYGLYMVIPLAVVGLSNVIKSIFSFFHAHSTSKIIHISLMVVIASIMIPQAVLGINSINAVQAGYKEEPYQIAMHEWIRNNIPTNSMVGSDLPHAVLMRTGLPAVNFQYSFKDNLDYERWIITKFNLDYLVFYYPTSKDSVGLRWTDLDLFSLIPVYEGPRNIIYKIIPN